LKQCRVRQYRFSILKPSSVGQKQKSFRIDETRSRTSTCGTCKSFQLQIRKKKRKKKSSAERKYLENVTEGNCKNATEINRNTVAADHKK
jgi:hypothetical protein